MRLGLLPSQKRALDRAFKKADAFDHFRARTRRAFLGLGFAAGVTGVIGFFVGRGTGRAHDDPVGPVDSNESPRLAVARRLAAAPDEQLWRERNTFLLAIEESGGDAEAWVGFRRLSSMVLGQPEPLRREVAMRLLKTSAHAPARADYQEWIERLRQATK